MASLQRGTLRLTRLIDNLLESVRIESGQLSIRRQPVSLPQVVEDAAEMLAGLFTQRRQTLEVALPPSCRSWRATRHLPRRADRGQLDFERLATLGEEARQHLGCILDDLRQRNRLTPDGQLAGLDPNAFEQVVDQPRQPQGAPLQRADQRLQLSGTSPDAVVQQLDRR